MGIHIRPRDQISDRASREMSRHTARAVVEAVAGSTTELQQIMSRDPAYPADPREVLAALIAYRRAQEPVDQAVAELLAWLEVGGMRRSAMSRGLGVQPATLQKILSRAGALTIARSCDLRRGSGGRWTVKRPPVRLDAFRA